MTRTLLIVGAGPGIGMAVARRFGREGFRVGLIARTGAKLDAYAAELAALGIEAAGFAADVFDHHALRAAIAAAQDQFGTIDVLEYGPMVGYEIVQPVLEMDPDTVRRTLDLYALGPIVAVNAVLGPMIERGHGALLFTTGASGTATFPSHGSVSLAMGALRQYVRMLNVALSHRGIYAGSIVIAEPPAPEAIADRYWDMMMRRDRVEHVFGVIAIGEAYETLAARGFGPGFPPGLATDLPEPVDAEERRTFLLGLWQAKINAGWHADPVAAEARADRAAVRLGGRPDATYYGASLTGET